MSRPVIVGAAGGVGTSTVAAALGADDVGAYGASAAARPVDVVVCRSTVASVERAHRVVAAVSSPPVLVVVADGPRRCPRAVRVLIAMVLPHVVSVIEVPFVASWRIVRDPLAQAAHAEHSDRDLVPFARSMLRLADTLREHRVVTARVVPASAHGSTEWPGDDDVDPYELEEHERAPEHRHYGRSPTDRLPYEHGEFEDPWGDLREGPQRDRIFRDAEDGDVLRQDRRGPDPSGWSPERTGRGRPAGTETRRLQAHEFGPGAARRFAQRFPDPPVAARAEAPPPRGRPASEAEKRVVDGSRARPDHGRRNS